MHLVTIKARYKVFLIFLFFLLLVSCGSPEQRYKVLTIFFDGVPEPGTQEEQSKKEPGEPSQQDKTLQEAQRAVIPIRSQHPDYEGQACDKCHNRNSSNLLRVQRDRICFLCHKEADYLGTYVHGPIAVGGCMACHLPHESRYDKLLIANSREICLYCHQAEDVARNPVHASLALEAGPADSSEEQPGLCTPCHDPHKGENRFFLRKGPPG